MPEGAGDTDSTPAISQAVRQLKEQLRVVLLTRTTRSVSLTDAGRRLVEGVGPALTQALAALAEVSAQPGETVGRVRLSVPQVAVPYVISPVVPTFRVRHPRVEVEVTVEDRFVDIVAEGYDAGVRLSEAIERDMVQVRLTPAFRSQSTGALYAWELERSRRNWRVPVRGSVVTNDSRLRISLAEQGLGLAYVVEPTVAELLREGRLQRVLEPHAPTVPGFFLYFPSRAQRSPALRLFVDAAKELAAQAVGVVGVGTGKGGPSDR